MENKCKVQNAKCKIDVSAKPTIEKETVFPVAVPDKIIGLTLILDFIDRCHSLNSLYLPQAALASLPTGLCPSQRQEDALCILHFNCQLLIWCGRRADDIRPYKMYIRQEVTNGYFDCQCDGGHDE